MPEYRRARRCMISIKKVFGRIYKPVERIVRSINNDSLTAYAAQASFFIVISAIPFIMLLTNFARFLVPIDVSDIIALATGFLPSSTHSFVTGIIDEIFGNSSIPIISVTAVVLLWSASKGVRSISAGMRRVYRTERHRNYFFSLALSIVYTLAFMLLLIAVSVMLLFGKQISAVMMSANTLGAITVNVVVKLRSAIFAILLTLAFCTIYRLAAPSGSRWARHLPGAMFSALGWIGFSFVYSIYIEHYSKYSVIYGSLTALILLMLWLYTCMIILLLGAKLNVWVNSQSRSA